MSNKHFIRELLSLSQKFNQNSSEQQQQSNEFQSNIMQGFMENLPTEVRDKIKKSSNHNVQPQDFIHIFNKMEKEQQDAFVQFFESLLDQLSNQNPMNHKGYTFDPTDIYNKYHKLKAQFTKYQESEDINNF